ncbi:phosphoenolpyruvate--protein phosphotransferase [Demequina sp. SYSU T00039]|uniref:Phosphoenolpyruvate-protein phosphotransferase n=1 Tax=Demequina lignilytica TaxID=3051663 RepID=A0AAW7M812_9MICO|nr:MULTISPECIES: phosphoenolpyruvate--protein phosphotransferase [unclassified Demequina]MDN4477606.1 phosphoenolpyruvate--protein phosphotransferase [Demequina sp. SYSU T00039-1]MDN4488043.1 phosphoenolpyruvate--protein phosphotransferase [Demequina sp. SYSU T00039]MDN4490483.1 phosphoenolpyruvate--protein phosphotransferase [Demequina sp. SYSU T00068]
MSGETFTGVGVSPGTAAGPVVQVAPPVRPPADEPTPVDAAAATDLVLEAFASVAKDLDARAEAADEHAAPILKATALIARDKGLAKAAGRQVGKGKGPATAIAAAVDEYAAQFEALGGYFAERVTDLRDVGHRAVAAVLGVPAPGVPSLTGPSVIVAEDLAPAETAALDRAKVVAIITAAGGRTSHTAILAAQMGIPAVVQLHGATSIAEGTTVAVDGDSGEVTLEPDMELIEAQRARREALAAALAEVTGNGLTRDGHPVNLLANIGGVDDAVAAGATDVEGVGLFRTEFVYLSAQTMPTVEEQAEVYRKVFEQFPGRRVVVRTLDAGADKPLAFANLGDEENPALGRRGLRLCEAKPELLDSQLEALAVAAKETGADVRVMAPMVATADEAAWFAERVYAHGLPKAGVMVEVPAVALRSKHVLAEVDFASIGTNDLAQYTMAADRMEGELSHLLDPWQPAVLDVVAAACDGADHNGKPIGVCGESAGDPYLALVLAGLGVRSLSMAPSKVPAVRLALSKHTIQQCRQLAHLALEARGAHEAREAVRAAANEELTAIL